MFAWAPVLFTAQRICGGNSSENMGVSINSIFVIYYFFTFRWAQSLNVNMRILNCKACFTVYSYRNMLLAVRAYIVYYRTERRYTTRLSLCRHRWSSQGHAESSNNESRMFFEMVNMQKTWMHQQLPVRAEEKWKLQPTCRGLVRILHFLHQAHSVCPGCGFWRGSALTFSDSKYGLCHHVYWLPANGRAVLNHCNAQQDRRGTTGLPLSPLPLSTWGPLMQALRVWPHSAFVLTTTNKYTHSEGKQSLRNGNPVWEGRRGLEKQSLGRELGNNSNVLLASPCATRDWHMTSWDMEYAPVSVIKSDTGRCERLFL